MRVCRLLLLGVALAGAGCGHAAPSRVTGSTPPTTTTAADSGAALLGSLAGVPLFPADNWWNLDISGAPVDSLSTNFINGTAVGGPSRTVHPDFGGDVSPFPDIYGMAYVVAPGSTPLEVLDFDTYGYADESDPGPYAVPLNAPIEGGAAATGDRHTLALDTTNCILYELYLATPVSGGASWSVGAVVDGFFTGSRTKQASAEPTFGIPQLRSQRMTGAKMKLNSAAITRGCTMGLAR
jgi:hypothetical protein